MSHLKGIATIQLFDAKTGELQQEIKEENMITNAVEECLNLPDYMATGLDRDEDRSHRLVSYRNSIANNFFNGVLIYRNPIEENAEKVMPPFDNPEIGHAGDTTAVTLDHQGTYNTVESGVIENGIRRVWDFATDRANGKISCVCLTSRAGGTLGEWRQQSYQMGGNTFTSSKSDTDSAGGYLYIKADSKDSNFESQLANRQIFYMERQENGEIKLLAKGPNATITEIILGDPFKQKLFSYSNVVQSAKSVFQAGTQDYIWYDCYNEGGEIFFGRNNKGYTEALKKNITEKSMYAYFSPYVYKNKIHIIYPLCNRGTFALRHVILNITSYAIEQDKTVILEKAPFMGLSMGYHDSSSQNPPAHYETLEDGRSGTIYPHYVKTYWEEDTYYRTGMFYFDDHYFYLDVNKNLIAANSDGSFDQTVATGLSFFTGVYIDEKSNYVLIGEGRGSYRTAIYLLKKIDNKYLIFWHCLCTNDTNRDDFSYAHRMSAPMKIKEKSAPLYAYGFMSSNTTYNYFNIYFGYLYTFMSTINNLSTPVTKTNGQTMKITYDIIQVED